MTSKTTTTSSEKECLKLQEFREFLHSLTASESPIVNGGGVEMRNCITRNNNETYPVNAKELSAEVLSTLSNHLTLKRCPRDFQLSLLRAAVEEVEHERKNIKKCDFASGTTDETGGFTDNGDDVDNEMLYDLIKLQKFALNNLEKLLTRLTSDNAEANSLEKYADEGALCEAGKCNCRKHSPSPPNFLVGAVKNKPRKMEDRYCCWPRYSEVYQLKSITSGQYSFYGVFDGHGGSLAASYAAAQMPQLCAEHLKQTDSSSEERMEALKSAFIMADQIFTHKHISSGTTAVCALHYRPDGAARAQLYIAWVGDSRAMLVSKTSRQQLVRSHKPDCPEERKRIESNDAGAVMFVHGQWRVNGILNVSRSIGDFSVSSVIAEPDLLCIDIMPDADFLVLGTDGLWDHASEEAIATTVYETLAKQTTNLDELPKLLLDLAKRGDSLDNITVVIVLLREPAKIIANLMSETPHA